jgi:hypothetical protein
MPFMNDTWRFIIVIALLVVLGGVLPFAADAAPPPGEAVQQIH